MLAAPLDPSVKTKPTPAEVEADGASFLALMGTPMQGRAGGG